MNGGTAETKRFYDEEGWIEKDGKAADSTLFGVREDGPTRRAAYRLRLDRIRATLRKAGQRIRFLEVGCGGNPELTFGDLYSHYTGVDFSAVGLKLADKRLASSGLPYELVQSDGCRLPFGSARFDAAYSAHVLYHIADPRGQEAARASAH